jgi:hypothetical protein
MMSTGHMEDPPSIDKASDLASSCMGSFLRSSCLWYSLLIIMVYTQSLSPVPILQELTILHILATVFSCVVHYVDVMPTFLHCQRSYDIHFANQH